LSGVNPHDIAGILSADRNGIDLRSAATDKRKERDYSITFRHSINAFTRAYLRGEAPPITGEDGLIAMRLEHAVVESAKMGRAISLH
jgi:predicted dehydrogenase